MRCLHERWRVLSVLIAVGAIPAAGLGGCGRADMGAVAADPAGVVSSGPPVTDEECRALVATIENAVQAGNGGVQRRDRLGRDPQAGDGRS